MPVTVEAELRRRDALGALVDWLLADDADNTATGKSDPVVDAGLRARIGEVSATPTANTVQDRLKGIRTVLDAINANTDGLEGFTDGLESIATSIQNNGDTVEAKLQSLIDAAGEVSATPTANTVQDRLKGIRTVLDAINANTDFKRLLKYEPIAGEELRRVLSATDDYHAAAPDGTDPAAPSWKAVRFYKDANGDVIRTRYRTGVAFNDITTGWGS